MVRRLLTLTVLAALLLLVGCTSDRAAVGPAPAGVGIDAAGAMHPGPDDRCPVCAMAVADKPMVAGLSLDDGRTWYFCGPGCLLRAHLHPDVFLGVDADAIAHRVVTEYFSGEPADAATVRWVAGSDVTGAMGPMIVPMAPSSVDVFQERHGGQRVFGLSDLDDALWQELTGKPAVRR